MTTPRLRFSLAFLFVASVFLGTRLPGPHTPIVIEVIKVVVAPPAPPAPPEPAPVERKATVGQVKIVTISWREGFSYACDSARQAGRLIEQGWSVLAIQGGYNGASIALQSPSSK